LINMIELITLVHEAILRLGKKCFSYLNSCLLLIFWVGSISKANSPLQLVVAEMMGKCTQLRIGELI